MCVSVIRQTDAVSEHIESIFNIRCKRPCYAVVIGNAVTIPLHHHDDHTVVASGNRQQRQPRGSVVDDNDNNADRHDDTVVVPNATVVVSATV